MADFLDEKRSEIAARLKELEPLAEEYTRLQAAAAALDGVGSQPVSAPRRASRRGASTPPRARGAGGGGRRGRPKGTGTRGAEALAIVKATPGIEIPAIAAQMGIKQNYLYRVLPGLEADGLVRREGRGWHPV